MSNFFKLIKVSKNLKSFILDHEQLISSIVIGNIILDIILFLLPKIFNFFNFFKLFKKLKSFILQYIQSISSNISGNFILDILLFFNT
ncbi:hypothetical protein AMV077 [Betaentomopoxvirus amoorei]|uniref:AMV077 n=1 Tax=Amsacta moorei entomopoxvirus TaxID=28321 RepID=Q9EMX2_AMEPV|nr:hypothetical protein AMV077 [Amsacta moorei entomopoxvirus]AAG02783.1 AMV077 [Amsacta moorei entomopoxvirus]